MTVESVWNRASSVKRVWMLGPITGVRKTRKGAERLVRRKFRNLPSDVKAKLRRFEEVLR